MVFLPKVSNYWTPSYLFYINWHTVRCTRWKYKCGLEVRSTRLFLQDIESFLILGGGGGEEGQSDQGYDLLIPQDLPWHGHSSRNKNIFGLEWEFSLILNPCLLPHNNDFQYFSLCCSRNYKYFELLVKYQSVKLMNHSLVRFYYSYSTFKRNMTLNYFDDLRCPRNLVDNAQASQRCHPGLI